MNLLKILGRENKLFDIDINFHSSSLNSKINNSKFLIIGGAGSIGSRVSIEIFNRNPKAIHVVDINENSLVELVRDIRSSSGYIKGDFKTFALDCGSSYFEKFFASEGPYDYVLNFSALKHVRSEKDPYTLFKMIEVNIVNSIKIIELVKKYNCKKYFCISTDKAANPVNMMGASKRIMEMFLIKNFNNINFSMARFANVAFSNGSLLYGFEKRMIKNQPISAPNDIQRYFLTEKEAAELCLMSTIFGENGDIFFPKLEENLHLVNFSDIAKRYLISKGFAIYECQSEEEARRECNKLIKKKIWPCYFFKSDTTGEKDKEEFFTMNEVLDLKKLSEIGIIKNKSSNFNGVLNNFEQKLNNFKNSNHWDKKELVKIFQEVLKNFLHNEFGKSLDEKM